MSLPCSLCKSSNDPAHAFCTACGVALVDPPPEDRARAQWTGTPTSRSARLEVVRRHAGEGGAVFHLGEETHAVGRREGQILLADDPFVAPRHGRFVYRDDILHVVDDGSANGTHVRLRAPLPLRDGDVLWIGEQLLRFQLHAPPAEGGEEEVAAGTPLRPSRLQVVQILEGGQEGLVYSTRRTRITFGREECDVNFPGDRYISGRHCRIELEGRRVLLVDDDSLNGTFIRIDPGVEIPLAEGDEIFMGRHLLRVALGTR